MTNPFPLLIVMGTIVALVIIQRVLSRVDTTPQVTTVGEDKVTTPPAQPKSRGFPLRQGLSVTGLDDRGVDQLKGFINKGDTITTALFLASQRPRIIELDEYLAQLRSEFRKSIPNVASLSNPDTLQEILASFSFGNPPGALQPNLLSARELLSLLTFDPKSQRLVTRDLITLFGGQAFNNCFDYYTKHKKSVAMQIQATNPDRQLLETMVQTEIADKGRHIPLALRLTILSMDQLRQMCKDLNSDIKFASKQELTDALSQIPGAAVLLSMQYNVDDLFILNPLKVKEEDIKKEWNFFQSYAKLLTTKSNLNAGLLSE